MIVDAVGREHYLGIGELLFDEAPAKVRTLLGSCVAITLWHSRLTVGGMCHYVLPARHGPRAGRLDARYGDEAVEILLGHLTRRGTRPADYVARIFGGSTTLGGDRAPIRSEIGERNVRAARELLERYAFPLVGGHAGGAGHRSIVLDLATGEVEVAHSRY